MTPPCMDGALAFADVGLVHPTLRYAKDGAPGLSCDDGREEDFGRSRDSGREADPSTSLRFGRDDDLFAYSGRQRTDEGR